MPVDRAVARMASPQIQRIRKHFASFHRFLKFPHLPQPLRFWYINRATGWRTRRIQSGKRD